MQAMFNKKLFIRKPCINPIYLFDNYLCADLIFALVSSESVSLDKMLIRTIDIKKKCGSVRVRPNRVDPGIYIMQNMEKN